LGRVGKCWREPEKPESYSKRESYSKKGSYSKRERELESYKAYSIGSTVGATTLS
jgi:hypothetical protein